MSLANELPHMGFDGYVGRIFRSSDEVFGNITIPDYTETRFLLPLTLSYEIDIWGKNHLKTKSQKKRFEALKQDEKTAYIFITSAFATDYYNLIKAEELIKLQKELIKIQSDVVSATEKKYEAGTKTIYDVYQEQKTLTFLKEDLDNLLEKQDTLRNQMNVILANRTFDNIKKASFDMVNPEIVVPEKISSDILNSRPDRIKSELNLERIGIDVKVARRELLPKFNIVGNLGFNAYSISSSNKFLANIGIVPSWDIFAGGRKIQFLKLQKLTK